MHRTSHDKLVWCLQRIFIGYTGLVVIKLVRFLQRKSKGITGLVVIN
jgi:hypothetical protein